jgi:hypothetical protein
VPPACRGRNAGGSSRGGGWKQEAGE